VLVLVELFEFTTEFVFVAEFVFTALLIFAALLVLAFGQAANSQFGGIRPTDEPSGHDLASMVQMTPVPLFSRLVLVVLELSVPSSVKKAYPTMATSKAETIIMSNGNHTIPRVFIFF